jgi:hypothetical protein
MSVVQVPRKERVEYGGALYHLMGRGNRLEAILCVDRDREVFLKTLGEASERCETRVSRYCGETAGRSDIQNFAKKIEMAAGKN